MIKMNNVNFESIEKAWVKPKKTALDELEEWLIKSYEYMSYTPVNEILRNSLDKNEEYGFFYNLNSIHDKAIYNEKVRKKIQELKKETK